MVPYEMEQKSLQELLDELFEGDGGSVPEDLEILYPPLDPDDFPFFSCCSYNYANY